MCQNVLVDAVELNDFLQQNVVMHSVLESSTCIKSPGASSHGTHLPFTFTIAFIPQTFFLESQPHSNPRSPALVS